MKDITQYSQNDLSAFVNEIADASKLIEGLKCRIGGNYTAKVIVSGTIDVGNFTVKTSETNGGSTTTKETITVAGSYDITIDDTDNYIYFEGSSDLEGDVSADIILKKKIVSLNASLYQGTWDALTDNPTLPTPSEANKGYWYRVSVAGNGYVIGDITVSNGVVWERIEIGNYELDDYVKFDGSTPFTAPQKGVNGVDADDLATVEQIYLIMPDSEMNYKGKATISTPTPTGVTNDTYIASENGDIFGVENVEKGDYLVYHNGGDSSCTHWWRIKKQVFSSNFMDTNFFFNGNINSFNVVQRVALRCIRNLEITYNSPPQWIETRKIGLEMLWSSNASTQQYGIIRLKIVKDLSTAAENGWYLTFSNTELQNKNVKKYINYNTTIADRKSSIYYNTYVEFDFYPYSSPNSYESIISQSNFNAKTIEITYKNEQTYTWDSYTEGAVEIGQYNSLPILDLYKYSGINKNNYDIMLDVDKRHPLDLGYEFTKGQIASFIKNNGGDLDLTGKTIAWYGDSYLHNATNIKVGPPVYNAVWSTYTDSQLGTVSTSYAIGGAGYGINCGSQIYDQVTTASDIAIICVTSNDYWASSKIGHINSVDNDSQAYGMQKTIDNIQTLNKSCRILLVTLLKGFSTEDMYNKAIIRYIP